MARRLYDLAVLGEGIVGCFAALRAAELGADVILIDERGVFGGASARAAGVFTVQLDTPRDAMLVAKSIELVKRYSKNSWIETGFLQIGREGALRESLEALTKCEIRYDVLDHREIMEKWPEFILDSSLKGIYTEQDLSVEPTILGRDLREALIGRGVRIYEGVGARRLLREGDELRSVKLSDSSTVAANYFVLAMGSWNRELLNSCNIELETFLLTCFAYRLDIGKSLNIPSFSDEYLHTYWRPWQNTLVGGRYDAEFTDKPDLSSAPPPLKSLKMSLKLLLKRLRTETEPRLVEHMRGPCSFTSDGLPVVGRIPGLDNAVIVDGLGGYGLMRGPALGYLATEALLRGPKTLDGFTDLSPSRVLKKHTYTR
ncbi:MAG: FAD-binding oxidoreductase [Nitrososphaerota archaeon]